MIELEELTEDEILKRFEPKIKKSNPPIKVVREDYQKIDDLSSLRTYRRLCSLKKKGISITEELSEEIYNEKKQALDAVTIKKLDRAYAAAFGQISVPRARYGY